MKTRDEILANWDIERLNDWYAVDSFDAATGRIHRLYVGDRDTAKAMAAERAGGYGLVDLEGNPAEPGEFAYMTQFYRATLISPQAAYDYMRACGIRKDHINELVPASEAAKVLGVSRQAVYDLIKRGKIHTEVVGNEYRIGRYSIELRKLDS